MYKKQLLALTLGSIGLVAFLFLHFKEPSEQSTFSPMSPHTEVLGSSTLTLLSPVINCLSDTITVNLSWVTGSSRSVTYFVERRPESEKKWRRVSTQMKNTTGFTDNSLTLNSGNYTYRVSGRSSSTGLVSNMQTVSTGPCTSTAPPSEQVSSTAPSPDQAKSNDTTPVAQTPANPPPVNPNPPPAKILAPPPAIIPPPPPKPTPPPPTKPTPPPAAPTPTPAPSATPPPAQSQNKKLWGAYTGDSTSSAASFESVVGKTMNIQALFRGWGSNGPFPSEFKASVADKGKTLLIFWEQHGTTLDSIIAGNSDTYIKQFVTAAKNYAGPVILAPLHEMNGDWDPWGGTVGNNTPAKVVSAWKHIHDVFGSVSNVKWGWAPNVDYNPPTTSIAQYYPGDAYVDYVGLDGFNFGSPWENFSQIFNTTLTQIKAYKKPIYIFSFASAEGSSKAAWITDALTVQIPKHPEIAGWIWFNANKEADWRVNSDSNSLSAFKSALP